MKIDRYRHRDSDTDRGRRTNEDRYTYIGTEIKTQRQMKTEIELL